MLGQLQHEKVLQCLNAILLTAVIEESDLHRISQHSEQMKGRALGKSVFQVKQRGNCSQQMLRRRSG